MSMFPTFVMPEPNDASLNYLSGILGHGVINDIIGAHSSTALDSHVFARMMDVFNHLLLGGGLLIFSVLLFVGTMNTAADGQFLGRNWHSVWTPVRLVFGIMLVVPLKSGYCLGQYIILYAIFIGINFATTVWQHAINDVFNDQDTPPPPTYLTTEIQQVLGQAVNNLAVPLILKESQLTSGSSNGDIIEIDVPNGQYNIADGNIPGEIKDAIAADLTGDNGVCSNLYSAYNKYCASIAYGALSNSSQSIGTFTNPDLSIRINIGNNVSTRNDWDSVFVKGMPQNPWLDSDSGANGAVNVYGAYIYNPNKLFSEITNNSTTQQCADGSTTTVDQNGNTIPCQPKNTNQGATDAYNILKTVFDSAVIQPAKGATMGASGQLSPESAQALAGVCSSQVSMQIPGQSTPQLVNACDLQYAVESIMLQAKDYALNQALDSASTVDYDPSKPGSTLPAQAASKPIPFPSDADPSLPNPNDPWAQTPGTQDNGGNFPKDGQWQALHSNMYKYQVNGKWHIGYNLDDYWIADINDQRYIDLQLNNSWWMAGSSYLVLDNILGQNLAWMAQSIQKQLELFQNAISGATINPDLKYQCVNSDGSKNFVPNTTPNLLTSFVTPEFCLSYGIQGMEYNPVKVKVQNDGYFGEDNNNYSKNCQVYKQVNYYGKVTNYYSCDSDNLRVSQPMQRVTNYMKPNIAVSNWQQLIEPYNPNDPGNVMHIDTSATPQFYQLLAGMPGSLQGPIAVMLTVAKTQGSDGYRKLYPYLVSLVNLLKYNGLLSGNQLEASLPVNHSINNIFDQLIGGHAEIGNAGTAREAASTVNTVMQQVYNLGLKDNSKGIIAAQFSLIQQAQTAGISMIMACVTSMESVYNAYTATLQGMVDKVNQMTSNPSGTIGSVEAETFASMVPIVGPIFGTLADNDMKNLQLSVMTTTVTTMTNIAIQLMWLPLLVFIMTSLFTAGVQFAILVPLMPYILFWAGQIAWLIGVIEAVVAAPLVMLGLAHPGGHEFMGHTVPAVKMLIGVMFRPVLMVIGLIVGILLTYIVINFSAQGFHTIAAGILNAVPQSEATVQGIMACLLLFIYATFLVMAFQKCFSTIYMIPEQVVQWIGGQAARAGAEELQQVSSASQQTAQGAASAGGQTLEKGIGAQKDRGQAMSDLSSKSAQTHYETNKAWAQTGKQYADAAADIAVKVMV